MFLSQTFMSVDFRESYVKCPGYVQQNKRGKKRYRDALSNLTDEALSEIPTMPAEKVLKFCSEKREGLRNTLKHMCRDLNADTSLIDEDLQQFATFKLKHPDIPRARWFFGRCYKPLINGVGEHLYLPSTVKSRNDLVQVITSKEHGTRNTSTMWINALTEIKAHDDFKEVVLKHGRYASKQEFWNYAKQYCERKTIVYDGGVSKENWICPVTETAISGHNLAQAFNYLKPLLTHSQVRTADDKQPQEVTENITDPWTEIGDISLLRAISLVTVNGGHFSGTRIVVLLATGFRHLEEMKIAHQRRETQIVEWKCVLDKMPAIPNDTCPMRAFIQLTTAAQCEVELVNQISASKLVDVIHMCSLRRSVYKIIMFLISNEPEKQKHIDQNIGWSVNNKTVVDCYLEYASPWRREMFETAMKEHKARVVDTSTNPELRYREISYMAIRQLQFLEQYVESNFKDIIPHGADQLRWFLGAATVKMFRDMFVAYGCQYQPNNELVKSTYKKHHASYVVTMFIRLVTKNLSSYLTHSGPVQIITPASILSDVKNLRVAYSGGQRTFEDDELKKMISVAKAYQPYELILTLLCEVALRVGCIVNIKYYDLLNQYHQPRTQCTVIEKNNKRRTFVVGPNLQRVIVSYARFVEVNLPEVNLNNFYAFNIRNPYRPLHSESIRKRLVKIGKEAGVDGRRVHPHVFRHTLVGKLHNEGNSMATIAAFLNHESVDVTFKHYFLKTVDDISKDLKSSYLKTSYTEEEIREEQLDENSRLKKKVEAMLNIFHVYNTTIAKYKDDHPIVEQIYQDIMTDIPNLRQLANDIADSTVSDTASSCSSLLSNLQVA